MHLHVAGFGHRVADGVANIDGFREIPVAHFLGDEVEVEGSFASVQTLQNGKIELSIISRLAGLEMMLPSSDDLESLAYLECVDILIEL